MTELLADSFRQAMRQLAATVTLVTTIEDGVRHGMPATAVCSLSLDPPSILVCINRSASMHGPTARSRFFCVNLLNADQAPLCTDIGARSGQSRFEIGEWRDGPHGLPWIEGAAAVLFCAVADTMEFGTHSIFVGVVDHIEDRSDATPLIFQGGKMGRFSHEEFAR